MAEASRRHAAPPHLRKVDVQQRRPLPDPARAAQRLEAADPVHAATARGSVRVHGTIKSTACQADQPQGRR